MNAKIVEKPWGKEVWIASNEHYICRILYINKGASVSLQYHKKKIETLYIEKGSAEYTIQKPGEERRVFKIQEGDILEHQPFEIHRERALEEMKIIEVSTPEIEDIVRIDDEYGRY